MHYAQNGARTCGMSSSVLFRVFNRRCLAAQHGKGWRSSKGVHSLEFRRELTVVLSQRVHDAFDMARKTRCVRCNKKGATIQCHQDGCSNTYHYDCATEAKANFVG